MSKPTLKEPQEYPVDKPFFAVQRVIGKNPILKAMGSRFLHADLETAAAEADRLAKQYPGQTFHVIQTVAIARVGENRETDATFAEEFEPKYQKAYLEVHEKNKIKEAEIVAKRKEAFEKRQAERKKAWLEKKAKRGGKDNYKDKNQRAKEQEASGEAKRERRRVKL